MFYRSIVHYKAPVILIMMFLSGFYESQAQFGDPFGRSESDVKRNPIRKILNYISISGSSGYGATLYSHKVEGFYLLQREDGGSYLVNNYQVGVPNAGYDDWVTGTRRINDIRSQPGDFVVDSDTSVIGYQGFGRSIPLNVSLHVNISRFRIGGGAAIEFHTIGKLDPISYKGELQPISPSNNHHMFVRYFGMIGYKVHDYWDYSFVPEIQVGKVKYGNKFENENIDKKLFFNLGMSIEKNLSEYFRILFRPSIEFKSYNLMFPESAQTILHKQPALFVTAGISLNYPEVPRCKIKSCQTQLKHVHFGKEYRGQPITKKQNPKYGENHPDLIKYKGKNKRIRSPF